MKYKIVIPATIEEMEAIRKYPQKPVYSPTYSKQKVGIFMYVLMLVYLLVFFILGAVNPNIDWPFYLLFLVPLTHSHNLLNVFAVVEDGLLIGSRFVPWQNIRSFQFVPIDTNHKFYGYSPEVNEGYELRMKGKIFTSSCLITSNHLKEKLTQILREHVKVNEK